MQHEHKIKLFACKASKDFALKVAKALNLELGDSDVITFSDGEFQPSYNESVRGATVFIVQSTFPPTDNLFELLKGCIHRTVDIPTDRQPFRTSSDDRCSKACVSSQSHRSNALFRMGSSGPQGQAKSFNRCKTCCQHA